MTSGNPLTANAARARSASLPDPVPAGRGGSGVHRQSSGALALAALAATVLAWASAFPVSRIALRDLDPIHLAALRFALAAVLMLAWIIWKRPILPLRSDAIRVILCGMTGIALYNVLLNTGQQTVPASASAFIAATVPAFTLILSIFVLKERVSVWGWLGTAVSFGGVAIIAAGQSTGLRFAGGSWLVLASAASQAVYFILQRPLVARYGAMTCTACTLIVGAILLVPWLPGAMAEIAAPAVSHRTIWALVTLAIVPSIIGYGSWTYALGHFGAARAAVALYCVPPVATLIAFVLAGEPPQLLTLWGGALAVGGVYLANSRGTRRLVEAAARP